MQLRGAEGIYWIDRDAVKGDAEAARALLDRLLRAPATQVYKDELGRSYVAAVEDLQAPDRRWVIKRYRQPRWRAWLEMRLGVGIAWREWRGARKLQAAGVRVCVPTALAWQRSRGEEATVLVLPQIDGQTLHHLIAARGPRPLALAEHIGRQAGRILAAGLVNRDHKAGNLMLDERALSGEAEPIIIDTVAIRRRTKRGARQMLATLHRTAMRAGPVTWGEIRMAWRGLCASSAGTAPRHASLRRARSERPVGTSLSRDNRG